MSTQSATCFEWAVKLIGTSDFYVGIATQFKTEESSIYSYDDNAILYHGSAIIKVGSNTINSNLPLQETGDVVRFTFQPHTKKLIINLVRV